MATTGLGGLSEGDSQLLVEVVDAYRMLLQAFCKSAVARSAMAAELRSKELLVTWISYCLLFEVRWLHSFRLRSANWQCVEIKVLTARQLCTCYLRCAGI
jgi:hypothetical protein